MGHGCTTFKPKVYGVHLTADRTEKYLRHRLNTVQHWNEAMTCNKRLKTLKRWRRTSAEEVETEVERSHRQGKELHSTGKINYI